MAPHPCVKAFSLPPLRQQDQPLFDLRNPQMIVQFEKANLQSKNGIINKDMITSSLHSRFLFHLGFLFAW